MAKAKSTRKEKDAKPSVSLLDRKWSPYILLTLLWAIIYALVFDTKLNLGGDNAIYYILGESISSGEGYSNIHTTTSSPANHFPPGYPLILGVFMLFSKSLVFLKLVTGLFFLGTALVSFRIFEIILANRRLAFVIAALLLLNGNLLEYSSILMSEIPFLFFSTLALLFFLKSETVKAFWKDKNFWLMLILVVFSFHIRTAGIALVGGLALFLLVQRKWLKFGVFSAGFIVLSAPWFIRGQNLGGSAYLKQLLRINPYRPEDGIVSFGDLVTRFFYNVERYISIEIPRAFFPQLNVQYSNYMRALTGEEVTEGYVPESYWVTGILILALIVFGVYKLKKFRSFVAFYLIGSATILLLWPYVWFGTRFILTLIPFLILATISGVNGLIGLTPVAKRFNPLLLIFLGLMFIPGVRLEMAKKEGTYPPRYADFLRASDYVGKNTPKDAVVSNRKPGLFYLYGGRKTTRFPYTFDFEEMRVHFENMGVTHVIIDAMGFADVGRYLVPFVQANPEKFSVVQQWKSGQNVTYLLNYNPNIGYQGEWEGQDGSIKQRTGMGKYLFSDGRIFTGSWKNGIRDGEGVMEFTNGMTLNAIWSNDTISGESLLQDSNKNTLLKGNYSEQEVINYINQGVTP